MVDWPYFIPGEGRRNTGELFSSRGEGGMPGQELRTHTNANSSTWSGAEAALVNSSGRRVALPLGKTICISFVD